MLVLQKNMTELCQNSMQVKMVTADDDSVTDIVVEGDDEEIDRMRYVVQY